MESFKGSGDMEQETDSKDSKDSTSSVSCQYSELVLFLEENGLNDCTNEFISNKITLDNIRDIPMLTKPNNGDSDDFQSLCSLLKLTILHKLRLRTAVKKLQEDYQHEIKFQQLRDKYIVTKSDERYINKYRKFIIDNDNNYSLNWENSFYNNRKRRSKTRKSSKHKNKEKVKHKNSKHDTEEEEEEKQRQHSHRIKKKSSLMFESSPSRDDSRPIVSDNSLDCTNDNDLESTSQRVHIPINNPFNSPFIDSPKFGRKNSKSSRNNSQTHSHSNHSSSGSNKRRRRRSSGSATGRFDRTMTTTEVLSGAIKVFNIMIIGESGAGKSTMLLKMTKSNFNFVDCHVKTTLAIDFDYVMLDIGIDDEIIHLNLWDSAGQERYRADVINKTELRNKDALVMCYDVSDMETFSKLSKWYDQVREVIDPKSVALFVIGCKKDKMSFRNVSGNDNNSSNSSNRPGWKRNMVLADVAKQYAASIGASWSDCSARTGQGVMETLNLIGQRCYRRKCHKQKAARKDSKFRHETDSSNNHNNNGMNATNGILDLTKRRSSTGHECDSGSDESDIPAGGCCK